MKKNYLSLYNKNSKFKESVTKDDIINTGHFIRDGFQVHWKPFIYNQPWKEQVKYRNALYEKFPEEKEHGEYGKFMLGFPLMTEGSFSEFDKYKQLDDSGYRMDELVKPTIYLLYEKGYQSYASCSGHCKGGKGYIIIDNIPKVVNAFKKAGFHIDYITENNRVHLSTNKYKSNSEEITIWRKAYQEIKKL